MPKKSTPLILAVTLVSIITYASVASSLTKSIILPSSGIVTYTSPTTIVVQVSASHDDAGAWWDWAGYYHSWELEKSHVSVGHFWQGRYYDGGLKFTNVDIPQEATIVSAVLKTCSDQTCEGTKARWEIYGQDSGDCAEFSTLDEFLALPKTTAVVDSGYLAVWVEGNWYDSPDISTVIQEIVNRPDWTAGNALALLLHGHPEAETTHEIRSYDANPSQAAVLEVAYKVV